MLCRLGGKKGIEEEVRAGDVMVIPAGVAHERYVQDPKTVSHSYFIQSYMAGGLQRKSVNGMSLYIDPLFAQTVVVHRCMHAKHCAAQHAAILNVTERPCQAKQE